MSSPYTFAASVGEALLSHFREYAKIAIVSRTECVDVVSYRWRSYADFDLLKRFVMVVTFPIHSIRSTMQAKGDVAENAVYEKVIHGLKVRSRTEHREQ